MRDVIQVITDGSPAPAAAGDFVVLDHDMRVRRRIVFTTVGGERIRLNQAEVVQLRDGDGLALDDGRVVGVLAKPEALLEITAHNQAELVRIAWHLGNRHLPTQLFGGRLRIRDDHVIAGMVEQLGGHWRRVEAPFDPEGGAYAGGGHHGHHDHHHHEPGEGHG
jgi:urease accessory protein